MQARKRIRHRANGCALVLREAEPELAREPRTPGAERQGSSAQARRLHELRSEFRFTSLAKKIRMTLAVIPQMRLRKHGSLPSTSRTRSRAVVFHSREGGWSTDLPRFHIREFLRLHADEDLAAPDRGCAGALLAPCTRGRLGARRFGLVQMGQLTSARQVGG